MSLGFLQSGSQLIGAGGGLHTTVNTLGAGDDLIHIHTFHKRADSFQIAVAPADKLNVCNYVILDLEEDSLGAGAFCFVFKLHDHSSFLYAVKFAVFALDSCMIASGDRSI